MLYSTFFEVYPHFSIVEKPEASFVEKYRGKIPDEFLLLWENYGWGTFMDGYLRLINPEDFHDLLFEHTSIPETKIASAVAITAYGGLLYWLKDQDQFYLKMIDFRYANEIDPCICTGKGIGLLFDEDFVDESYIWEHLKATSFRQASKLHGVPSYDECYAHVPLLTLGGSHQPENLKIVKLIPHVQLMAGFR